MEKRRDHYINKDTGFRAHKDAPKNYTAVHNVEKVEKQTTTEPEIMQTHPADEVMNDLLNDDEFISPFQKALKQVQEKKKHKQGNVRCYSLKTKEETHPTMLQSPYSLHTPFLLNDHTVLLLTA
ncbi:hypothetical protein G6F29_014041 [Rhizopus arrhizus]|nr:hypothetical protein G6F29_014041 [Rhizopus arrhizus]KAG0997944.1 hypothetical protein G6F27_013900 [Rhizopus arrhizus]KAG1058604.1 hypothetical protein G6F41_013870 [Rhizopus arrhizus]